MFVTEQTIASRAVTVPIPDFRNDGWLPEGHHKTSWNELEERFGGKLGSHRQLVMEKLIDWRNELKKKGISGLLILDGSFISGKENPKDFDALFIYDDHVEKLLAEDQDAALLLNYGKCKEIGFDLFALSAAAARDYPQWVHTDLWDKDKDTGKPKGVLELVI